MSPKAKTQDQSLNSLVPPSVDLDHTLLADRGYQITETFCDCDFLELCCWLEEKHIDKIGEMMSSTLTNTPMSLSKFQVSFTNVQSQLKMVKVSFLAEDNRIKSLEDLVIKIGCDPKDVIVVEQIIKKKNLDIVALRKQLKLLATEDPMTKAIAEDEAQKTDMMNLIIDQNIQIRQMEIELEKLVKEKEDSLKMVFVRLDVVPLSQFPSIGTIIAPTTSTQTPSVEQVARTLKNMSLESKEIETLQSQLKTLEIQKAKAEASRATELDKNQRLLEMLRQAERDTYIGQTLAQAKETIWVNILDSMNEIWPLIQIIFEQKELIEKTTQTTMQGRERLGEMPTEAAIL